MDKTTEALSLIAGERVRQQAEEGYTPAHDDEHTEGQLALLAAAYALSSRSGICGFDYYRDAAVLDNAFGWMRQILKTKGFDFKPKSPISDLVRAGALILAELERRLRRASNAFIGPLG